MCKDSPRHAWHDRREMQPDELLVFMVDAADPERFDEAKTELHVRAFPLSLSGIIMMACSSSSCRS